MKLTILTPPPKFNAGGGVFEVHAAAFPADRQVPQQLAFPGGFRSPLQGFWV